MGSYLAGPLIVLLAIGLLLLVARWASGQQGSLIARPATRGHAEEYGLMVPVASPADGDEADRITATLVRAGLRAQSVQTSDGWRVMVWTEQVDTARALLDEPSPPPD